jgi:hypothetical protein
VKVQIVFTAENEQEKGMLELMKTARPEIVSDDPKSSMFLFNASLADANAVTGALCQLDEHLAKIKMGRKK